MRPYGGRWPNEQGHRCEYCGMPDWEAVVPHEPDHIIATQHGGQTAEDNLAYACFDCNRIKGSNIASVDPASGQITSLFHPRFQRWE
ncbi:MAG: HNH endonuclease [Ktedonobacterales bacterium]